MRKLSNLQESVLVFATRDGLKMGQIGATHTDYMGQIAVRHPTFADFKC